MIFLLLVEFVVDGVLALFELALGWYVNGSSYLLRFNVSLYTGAVDSNKEWFAESNDIRLLMDLGNCLMIAGGWFEFRMKVHCLASCEGHMFHLINSGWYPESLLFDGWFLLLFSDHAVPSSQYPLFSRFYLVWSPNRHHDTNQRTSYTEFFGEVM